MKKRLPHIITYPVDVETETHESIWPLVDVSEIGKKKQDTVKREENLSVPSFQKARDAQGVE